MASQQVTLAKALTMGLRQAMEDDPKVLIMGEDVGKLGGVFRVTDGLQKDFGEDRVVDTPLAESAILGTAIGMALRGYRPVCEIQFDGFVYPAFDQIVSQLAKMHFRSQGKLAMPVVVRIPFGGGIGAVEHHSESPEAYFAHTAGLKVVACSNPADAYWMIQQAIACDDPVIFLEPKRRYWEKAGVRDVRQRRTRCGLPGSFARVGRDDRGVRADGEDSLEAATAAAEEGRSLEIVDLRSLSPLDDDTLAASVEKTRRLVVVHEAPVTLGLGAEIAARITERCFYALEAPVLRVGGFDTPYPRPGSRRSICPTSTACSTPSTARSRARGLAMTLKQFKLPDVGEGLTEGEILSWRVQPGDTVTVNQILVEVETAKAAVELPSPYAGVVTELHVGEGTTVDVARRSSRSRPSLTAPGRRGGSRRRPCSRPPYTRTWCRTSRRRATAKRSSPA